mmetsp:Transcript_3744/g.9242  ORF Transcript_3744/g.9242 Transcript_3744/m.9242 type:complete len:208 (-) Transcript_3744:41-664(-)
MLTRFRHRAGLTPHNEARAHRITAAERIRGRQEDGREREGDGVSRGICRGRGHPGHGLGPHVPRPQGRLRRLPRIGDALLVPLRGPHGDELPVRQDLRLVVRARPAHDLRAAASHRGMDGSHAEDEGREQVGARLPARDRLRRPRDGLGHPGQQRARLHDGDAELPGGLGRVVSALLRLTTSLQVRGGLRRPGLRHRRHPARGFEHV